MPSFCHCKNTQKREAKTITRKMCCFVFLSTRNNRTYTIKRRYPIREAEVRKETIGHIQSNSVIQSERQKWEKKQQSDIYNQTALSNQRGRSEKRTFCLSCHCIYACFILRQGCRFLTGEENSSLIHEGLLFLIQCNNDSQYRAGPVGMKSR